jgi:hypothetical protein
MTDGTGTTSYTYNPASTDAAITGGNQQKKKMPW